MLFNTIYPMALALILDQVLGDPAWLFHPIVAFGGLISRLEKVLLKPGDSGRLKKRKGLILVLCLLAAAIIPSLLILHFSQGWLRFAITAWLFYWALALRTMAREAHSVYEALLNWDLAKARQRVARIVGRDTAGLDEEGVAKACIESVAESSSDGVMAPLFWGLLLGPAGAMAYKAVNTMDSMVGYRNDRYEDYGWAAAKLDDVLNFIPARLTALFAALTAWAVGGQVSQSLRAWQDNHNKQPSPNSGHPEAAFAGALNVRLGGSATYGGVYKAKPLIHPQGEMAGAKDIVRANHLMSVSSLLPFCLLLIIAYLLGGRPWTI